MCCKKFTAPVLGALAGGAMILCGPSAIAQETIADFYKGQTVTMVLAGGAGGSYGAYSQLVAPFLEKHIPGNPTVVVQYMPGAGGTKAANYIYNVQQKDGKGIGMVLSTVALSARIRSTGIKYDPTKFNYLGGADTTSSLITVMKTAGVSSFAEAMEKEVVLGAGGKAGPPAMCPLIANAVLGTKFKIVFGYAGLGEIDQAVERGEVAGRCVSWKTTKFQARHWLEKDLVVHLALVGLDREADLPNVPTMMEFAKNEKDRALLELVSSDSILGRAWVAPPGVPTERLSALRDALSNSLRDPGLLTKAKKSHMDVRPVAWQRMADVASRTYNADPKQFQRIREILGLN